jgi:hypothetical protein
VRERRIEELQATYRYFQTKYRELHAHFTTLRQGYYLIACAWCQKRMRWVRKARAVPGEISHSICPPCAARLLTQMQATKRGVDGVQLPKHGRKTGKATTMAHLPPRSPLGTLPSYGLLAPGAHNLAIGLLANGPP